MANPPKVAIRIFQGCPALIRSEENQEIKDDRRSGRPERPDLHQL